METKFDEIKVSFKNRLTTISLKDYFYQLSQDVIGIIPGKYRELGVEKLSLSEYNEFIKNIKLAIKESENKVDDFFEANKEEIEPLYSKELDYYYVDFDLISYKVPQTNETHWTTKFDILMDCMDKYDQPIFMYDERGCCCISFELNSKNELKIIEISS